MTDTSTSSSPPTASTPAASTSASNLDWLYVYALVVRDLAVNAGAALVAKIRKWSPLAQILSASAAIILLGWLSVYLDWPSHHQVLETPATVDTKIDNAKRELQVSIEKLGGTLTDAISRAPTTEAIAHMTVGKSEFSALQASVADIAARLKKLEAQVAAIPAPSRKNRR